MPARARLLGQIISKPNKQPTTKTAAAMERINVKCF